MQAWGNATGRDWDVAAPILEDVLAELAEQPTLRTRPHLRALVSAARIAADRLRPRDRSVADDAIVEWVIAAIQAQVLTYGQGARAVQSCIAELIASREGWFQLGVVDVPRGRAQECETWSVREGHTTSVWRVELRGAGWPSPITFAVNLARDREAASELVATTAAMRRLAAADPQRIVAVLAERTAVVETAGGRLVLPIVISPWLDGARELQVTRDFTDAAGRFLVVDRFVGDASELPAPHRARGQLLTPAASDGIWSESIAMRARAAELVGERLVLAPRFELNEGDLVWDNGAIRVIAVSAPEPPVPIACWVLDVLAASTGSGAVGADPIYWRRPMLAAVALRDGLSAHATLSWANCVAEVERLDAKAIADCARTLGKVLDEVRTARDGLIAVARGGH